MFSLNEPCLNCSLRFLPLLLPAFEHHPLLYLIRPDPCMLGPDVPSDGLMKFAMLLKDHCSSCRRKSRRIKPIRVILAVVQADTRALVSRTFFSDYGRDHNEKPFEVGILDKLKFPYRQWFSCACLSSQPNSRWPWILPESNVLVLLIVHFCGLFDLNLMRFEE